MPASIIIDCAERGGVGGLKNMREVPVGGGRFSLGKKDKARETCGGGGDDGQQAKNQREKSMVIR